MIKTEIKRQNCNVWNFQFLKGTCWLTSTEMTDTPWLNFFFLQICIYIQNLYQHSQQNVLQWTLDHKLIKLHVHVKTRNAMHTNYMYYTYNRKKKNTQTQHCWKVKSKKLLAFLSSLHKMICLSKTQTGMITGKHMVNSSIPEKHTQHGNWIAIKYFFKCSRMA
jgi:hypothetical protein